jgi:hypothetical protein
LLGNPAICAERLGEVSFWNRIALRTGRTGRTGFVFDFEQESQETEL